MLAAALGAGAAFGVALLLTQLWVPVVPAAGVLFPPLLVVLVVLVVLLLLAILNNLGGHKGAQETAPILRLCLALEETGGQLSSMVPP